MSKNKPKKELFCEKKIFTQKSLEKKKKKFFGEKTGKNRKEKCTFFYQNVQFKI